MAAKFCTHIFADGHVCGSPALRGDMFCYYHSRDRQRTRILRRRVKKLRSAEADLQTIASLNLPTPDNPVATQVCIAGILQAMMSGVIAGTLGGRLLYGLHMAKCNYREVDQFNKRFLDVDLPLSMIPIAATDPEPIVDADAKEEDKAQDEADLKKYAKHFKSVDFERPTINDEITEAECAIDSTFDEALYHIDSQSDTMKEYIRRDLNSGSRSRRTEQRKEILKSLVQEIKDLRIELLKAKTPPTPPPVGCTASGVLRTSVPSASESRRDGSE